MREELDTNYVEERKRILQKRAYRKMRRRRKRIKVIKRVLLFLCLLFCIKTGWNYVKELPLGNSLVSDKGQSPVNRKISDQKLTKPQAYSDSEVQAKLKRLSNTSTKYREIYQDMDQYPIELLAALCSNSEMLGFVSGYKEADHNTNSEFTKEELKESFPLLLQWDKRWGYSDYGNSCIGLAGCAPTCISMVALELVGDQDATPDEVAAYAQREGYYIEGTGTSWSLMTEGALHFGIDGKELSLDRSTVLEQLQTGHPIICSMSPGDFTTQGHFIVLAGVQDGKIIVNDPNSRKRSSMLWDYDTLAGQIKNLWGYTKK